MRVDGDGTGRLREGDEYNLGCFYRDQGHQLCSRSNLRRMPGGKGPDVRTTYWVIGAKSKAQAIYLIQVEWVGV